MSDWNAETAEWYAANYGDYPTNHLAIDYLDLRDHISIVDIGCGTGSALRHSAQKIEGGNLIGIDPVPRMIEIAREQTKNDPSRELITFKIGSVEAIPIEDSFADFVFAFDSIDHWQDVKLGLIEVRRILKPDGKFVIVKDKSVPKSAAALSGLSSKLKLSGFNLIDKTEISKEEVSFALWICE